MDDRLHRWQRQPLGARRVLPQRQIPHVLLGVDLRLEPLGDLPGHQRHRRLRFLDQPGPGDRVPDQRQLQRDRPEPGRRRFRPMVAGSRLVLVRYQAGAARPGHRQAAGLDHPQRRRPRRRGDRGAVPVPARLVLLPVRVLRTAAARARPAPTGSWWAARPARTARSPTATAPR